MSEEDYDREYAIPANFTDSGGVLGGKFRTRNAVEAAAVLVFIGYPAVSVKFLPLQLKCAVCAVIVLPLVIFSLTGIDGDSFTQYITRFIKYRKNRRKLHLRRFSYHYIPMGMKNGKRCFENSERERSGKIRQSALLRKRKK